MPSGELDPQLVGLGRDVERTGQRVDRIETLLRLLSEQVGEHDGLLKPDAAEAPPVRSWLQIKDAAQAREDLVDLTAWLAEVYLRYPDAALASCWLWHPTVVEELWWLRQAHYDAYEGPLATYSRAGDWHDRLRPGVARRVRAALSSCELALHQQPPLVPAVPLVGAVDRVVELWATTRGTPLPTEEELAEAERHDHRNSRSGRR
ncbi:MAG: hypothetical protein ACRDRL_14320 [Sciscionella sp.]